MEDLGGHYLGKIKKVKYATKERIGKINPDNIKVYKQYLKSNILKNKEVENKGGN